MQDIPADDVVPVGMRAGDVLIQQDLTRIRDNPVSMLMNCFLNNSFDENQIYTFKVDEWVAWRENVDTPYRYGKIRKVIFAEVAAGLKRFYILLYVLVLIVA